MLGKFVLLMVVLGLAFGAGLVLRLRRGTVRKVSVDPRTGRGRQLEPALASTLGLPEPGAARATLLQFSSAFCAPCRATRAILGQVAATVPGVHHIEVDAESHLDAVRALGVLSTPTTFVLDADLHIVNKATGQPRKSDVLTALTTAL
ncbi:MAG: TlpA family protein disulfide reductase [Mycobacteriales bacterium]